MRDAMCHYCGSPDIVSQDKTQRSWCLLHFDRGELLDGGKLLNFPALLIHNADGHATAALQSTEPMWALIAVFAPDRVIEDALRALKREARARLHARRAQTDVAHAAADVQHAS